MRYKILKDGKELNFIISEEAFVTAYCAANGYTFEEAPLPITPEPTPEPTEEEDLAAMTVDHEYRLTLLELGLTEEV